MRQLKRISTSVPFLFGLLTILCYGLLINRLGYYWDDWVFVFLSHFYGPAEMIRAFATNRPLLGYIFFFTTGVLGNNPILWQAFGLFIRFLLTCVTWWALSQAWPQYRIQNLITSLFFLVYPGYSQQWVAFTHINQEWIPLIAYISSIGLSLYAAKNQGRYTRAVVLALALMFLGLFSTEYFIAYEAIRLGLFYVASDEGEHASVRIKWALRHWLPYLALFILYGIWQAYFRLSGAYQSYEVELAGSLGGGPVAFMLELGREALHTIAMLGGIAWWQMLHGWIGLAGSPRFWLAIALVLLSFGMVFYFLLRINHQGEIKGRDRWALQAAILGVVAILAGRLPSWVAGLPLSLRYEFDRFNISMMLGACLLLAAAIEFFLRSGRRKIGIAALIVALGVQHQYSNALSFRQDWQQQRNFLSQLTWRIPAMHPGTILLTHQIDFIPYNSDMGLTAALNWVYAPDLTSHELPYVFLFTRTRLGEAKLPGLEPGQAVSFDYRTARFQGVTSHSILFHYPQRGCLKLVDANADESSFSGFPEELEAAIPLSDLGRIDAGVPSPALPKVIFGEAAQKAWCYYYQKAQLARQEGDWEQVLRLGDEARRLGCAPVDPLEWIPFIEGCLLAGDVESARAIAADLVAASPEIGRQLCKFFTRMQAQPLAQNGVDFAARYLSDLGCEP